MTDSANRRDRQEWAANVGELHVDDDRDAVGVQGRRVTSPIHGFGKMWQKTYRAALAGVDRTPQQVIEEWKRHYGDFWPEGNEFFGSSEGIAPGQVGVISGKLPGGPKVKTGVLVLYADDESWAFMTPEGHPFAGIITFSVEEGETGPVAQIQLLIRAHDPLVEAAMPIMGHRQEDRLWQQTLTNLATHFGVEDVELETKIVCVDKRRQWKRFGNLRRSRIGAAIAHPFRR
ncbi:MAG: hypothetical protein R3249_02460 [Nitriliruptorales bacterium]|nr:hypothetical protein [Nitriliruptorales bacterium]